MLVQILQLFFELTKPFLNNKKNKDKSNMFCIFAVVSANEK